MKVGVILPAAGVSRRFSEGAEFPRSKLDEDLGGRSVLQRTVELFTKHDAFGSIVVAGPAADDAFNEFKTRHADKLALLGVTLCRGGRAHRYETVREGLAHVPDDCTHIAVHDAARPCTPPELLDRVLDAASRHAAVAPAIEVGDTLKRYRERGRREDEGDPLDRILGAAPKAETLRVVEATLDRERVVAVQTPQVFHAPLLRRAYAQGDLSSTDDAQLVERLLVAEGAGGEVVLVEGDPRNIKITRPIDIVLARAILGLRGPEGRPAHLRF